MAAAAIWDFRNFEFLFAVGIWRAQAHHCTKFCQNRSFHCGDIVIFRIFRFLKSRNFYRTTAMLSGVYAVVVCLCVCLSVCVCVCVSVTLQYCIKTAKRRITQTTPHDSPMTLVFWCQRSWRNSNGITPYGGDKCRWGGLKLVTCDEKRAITRKWYKIDV